MNNGWIKLHRKLMDNPIAKRSQYWHLWTFLLLKASHKESDFIWNNQKITLKPGQILTGRSELSRNTGIPESTVEKILKYLKTEHQIEQQTTNKFRIITIKNWGFYQNKENQEQQIGQQRDSNVTKEEQQRDIYKNIRKVNNKVYTSDSIEYGLSELLLSLILKRKPDFKKQDLQKWSIHIDHMIRLDNRKPERIKEVIKWCQVDSFWQDNVLSTAKLREKFDQLEMKMNKGDSKHGSEKIQQERNFDKLESAIGETIPV